MCRRRAQGPIQRDRVRRVGSDEACPSLGRLGQVEPVAQPANGEARLRRELGRREAPGPGTEARLHMAQLARSTRESRHGSGGSERTQRVLRRPDRAAVFARLHIGAQAGTGTSRPLCTNDDRHLIYRSVVQLRIRMGNGEAPPSSAASQADRTHSTKGLHDPSVPMDAHGTPLTTVFRAPPIVFPRSVVRVPSTRLRRYGT